eukprot:12034047-Alexandrium_andersonii.AAC.1
MGRWRTPGFRRSTMIGHCRNPGQCQGTMPLPGFRQWTGPLPTPAWPPRTVGRACRSSTGTT